MIIDVGGPGAGATSKDAAGFTSTTAFGYRGTGPGSATIAGGGITARTVATGDRLRFYTLTADARPADPSGWRLEGSTDGRDWSVLDERRDQIFSGRRQTRPFSITVPAAARHYRLVITAAARGAALAEIELPA